MIYIVTQIYSGGRKYSVDANSREEAIAIAEDRLLNDGEEPFDCWHDSDWFAEVDEEELEAMLSPEVEG